LGLVTGVDPPEVPFFRFLLERPARKLLVILNSHFIGIMLMEHYSS